MQVNGPEVTSLPESIRSTRISLNRMVFHQEDESECQDYSDEEDDEDEDEPFDEDIEFSESIVNEPEAVVDEIEEQAPIVVNSEVFLFRDKIHQLMYQFYYRSGGVISQSLMKDIVKLVKGVTEAKVAYPKAKVPAADLIFSFDDSRRTRNQILLLRQMKHYVKVQKKVNGEEVEEDLPFYMNPPSEVLKLLVLT